MSGKLLRKSLVIYKKCQFTGVACDFKAKHIANEYAELFKEPGSCLKGYIQAINETVTMQNN